MNGDPIDPISFERAVSELWDRLAAHAGLNLTEHLLGSDEDEQSPQLHAERRERDDVLVPLRDEAQLRLWGHALVGELRTWTAEGDHWTRPTEQVLRNRLNKATDEPTGLYIDRAEMTSIIAARWPELAGFEPSVKAKKGGLDRPRKKPGPKKGLGFNPKDVPSYETILRDQRRSRDAEKQLTLIKRIALTLEGQSYEAAVERYRKALPKWLAHHGHEWISPK